MEAAVRRLAAHARNVLAALAVALAAVAPAAAQTDAWSVLRVEGEGVEAQLSQLDGMIQRLEAGDVFVQNEMDPNSAAILDREQYATSLALAASYTTLAVDSTPRLDASAVAARARRDAQRSREALDALRRRRDELRDRRAAIGGQADVALDTYAAGATLPGSWSGSLRGTWRTTCDFPSLGTMNESGTITVVIGQGSVTGSIQGRGQSAPLEGRLFADGSASGTVAEALTWQGRFTRRLDRRPNGLDEEVVEGMGTFEGTIREVTCRGTWRTG